MPANIRFQEVRSLIDFMYHGEVAIPTEDVNQFLAVAEQFKVRGLYQERSKPQPGAPQFRKMGPGLQPKSGVPSRPMPPNVPPDIRQRLPPGISMMKSGASPLKRPRLDLPQHPAQDESADDITEIPGDEDESNDYYPGYGEEYDEQGWDGEPPPPNPIPAPPSTSRGPQLMGLLCPNCRIMCHGVPALKEHMLVCTGAGPSQPTQPSQQQGHFPGSHDDTACLCHVCDKPFKSQRTLDNHLKKQHGLSLPPKPPGFRGQAGRGKKMEGRIEGRMENRLEGRMEGRIMEGEEGWVGAGFPQEPPIIHTKEAARPVGQVAPAQRSTTPKSEHGEILRPPSEDGRRGLVSPRGGRGRGAPMSRGGFTRPGMPPMQVQGQGMPGMQGVQSMPVGPNMPSGPSMSAGPGMVGPGLKSHSGPSHPLDPGVPRPDLQKLGLKFGGQISITSTGNQGKKMMGGPGDGTGVSITKLKGEMSMASPLNIRDPGQKTGPEQVQIKPEDPGQIKTEPGVKEEPKEFEPDMEDGMERGEEGEFEEYAEEEEYENDGVYHGDGEYEGMEGEEEEEGEGEEIMHDFDGDGYPELGGDYDQEG